MSSRIADCWLVNDYMRDYWLHQWKQHAVIRISPAMNCRAIFKSPTEQFNKDNPFLIHNIIMETKLIITDLGESWIRKEHSLKNHRGPQRNRRGPHIKTLWFSVPPLRFSVIVRAYSQGSPRSVIIRNKVMEENLRRTSVPTFTVPKACEKKYSDGAKGDNWL